MHDRMKAAGAALIQVLEPFQRAQGQTLTAVLLHEMEEGEELILAFGTDGLTLSCDGETDTIDLNFGPLDDVSEAEDLTGDSSWSRFIGKEFFWGWLTINQQGYADGALISFDGVVPEIGLNVVASAFEFLEIRKQN